MNVKRDKLNWSNAEIKKNIELPRAAFNTPVIMVPDAQAPLLAPARLTTLTIK